MTEFPNPIRNIIFDRLLNVLKELGCSSFEDIAFYLIPERRTDIKFSNSDDIYRFWITPKFCGHSLGLSQTIDFLATHRNTAPLRMRINYVDGAVIIHFSERFRKIKIIEESQPDNENAPFIIDKNIAPISRRDERKAILRSILFARSTEFVKNPPDQIEFREIADFFANHFNEGYRFYPPNVNSLGEDESHLIEKIPGAQSYSIRNTKYQSVYRKENLTLEEVATIFMDAELNWKVCGIPIMKN